jgi:hypothetical protein
MGGADRIRDSLSGAWAVMNGDAAGLARLDLTVGGFWRSFGAIVLILPLALLALTSERALLAETGELQPPLGGALLTVRLAALAADWLAFPVLFALIARRIGVAVHYVPFIVALNWSSVWVSAFYAVPSLLHVLGVLPAGLVQLLLLALFVLAIRFYYLVARTALQTPPALAIPIVIVQFLISLAIAAGADALVPAQ